jgi:UDP-N-acetylglucosamine 2-epimerase (non-hydrolysing)
LARGEAVVVTLHRPSNVDDPGRLRAIAGALREIAEEMPVVFPLHPRTTERVKVAGVSLGKVRAMPPVRYVEMLDLVADARAVVTDSGGLQEETTYLGIPCLTMRENTERPITVDEGTNRLVPPEQLVDRIADVLAGTWPTGRKPALWDGRTAARCAEALRRRLGAAQAGVS